MNSLSKLLLPPKPYVLLGNQMFLLSVVILVISAFIYDIGEAFVAVEVGIIHYLFNLRFKSTKSTWLGSIRPLITTLIAVPLSMVPIIYAPFTSALFVFILVITEGGAHHQTVPTYILPLTFMLLSMIMPVDIPVEELMSQRAVSVVLGIFVAIIASTLVWPNKGTEIKTVKSTVQLSAIDIKYSIRKALGIGLLLSLGLLGCTGAALGAYLFMMIHSPFTKNLVPKARQRLTGTLLGALVYFPIGLLLFHIESSLVVTVIIWIIVITSLYGILVYLEHNYILATSFIMLLILTIAIGPFNSEMVEIVLSQRIWFTLIGGGAMIVLGFLIPLGEKDVESKSDINS